MMAHRSEQDNCESANAELSLPGFRYDPIARRYFKIDAEPIGQSSHNSPTVNNSDGPSSPDGSVTSFNFPCVLRSREIGMTSPSFTREAMSTKMRYWKCGMRELYYLYPSATCGYVKSFENFAFGSWILEHIPTMHLRGINFHYLETSCGKNSDQNVPVVLYSTTRVVKIMEEYKPSDICIEKFGHDEVFVLSGSNSLRFEGPSNISLQSFPSYPSADFIGSSNLDISFNFLDVVESCSLNPAHKQFAVGLENRIVLNSGQFFADKEIHAVRGRPLSLEYSRNGSLLFYGLHYGVLKGFDLRLPRKRSQILDMFVERGLHNIKLLKDQKTMIVSGYDNLLGLIDIRAKQSILEYPYHVNRCKKLVFTVDETLDMLCCTGQDNYTRLWSLKDGKFLSSIEPLVGTDSPSFSWLNGNTGKPLLHIFQNNEISVFEPKADKFCC